MKTLDVERIWNFQRKFAADRDWDQFHTAKNLVMALIGETAELQEIFQWLTPEEAAKVMEKNGEAVRQEMADVLYYLLRLADRLGVDLESAFWQKQELNAKKYPVELAKGKA